MRTYRVKGDSYGREELLSELERQHPDVDANEVLGHLLKSGQILEKSWRGITFFLPNSDLVKEEDYRVISAVPPPPRRVVWPVATLRAYLSKELRIKSAAVRQCDYWLRGKGQIQYVRPGFWRRTVDEFRTPWGVDVTLTYHVLVPFRLFYTFVSTGVVTGESRKLTSALRAWIDEDLQDNVVSLLSDQAWISEEEMRKECGREEREEIRAKYPSASRFERCCRHLVEQWARYVDYGIMFELVAQERWWSWSFKESASIGDVKEDEVHIYLEDHTGICRRESRIKSFPQTKENLWDCADVLTNLIKSTVSPFVKVRKEWKRKKEAIGKKRTLEEAVRRLGR